MARKSFEQTVARIRQLDATETATQFQVAFEMGDEVLAQAPIGLDGVNNESSDVLTRLAAETGVDYEVLRQRRDVSSRIPPATRVAGVPWAVHREIAYVAEPERSALLKKIATETATQYVDGAWRQTPSKRWTVDAIRTHIEGKKAANPAAGSVWLLERAFKEATPEAVADALEKPEVRRAVYEGLHQRDLRAADERERFIAGDPIAKRIDQSEAMVELQKWVDVMRRHIERLHEDILPRLGKASDRDPMALRLFLADAMADLDNATAPIRTFIDTGGTDIDRFLADVLGGGTRD